MAGIRASLRARRLSVRQLWLSPDRVLTPGEIVWNARGDVVSVRRCRSAEHDLAVLPGLVDAHVHLQIDALAGGPRAFLPWVARVMAQLRSGTAAARRAVATASLRQLAADGCTALGEIDSTGAGCTALLRSPLLARCYQELTGFHLDAEAARALVRARWQPAVSEVVAGLSPHAPYSVSPALFAAAAAQSRWLQVHCAETMEEVQFLRSGRGPFRELLARLGRLPAGFRSPRATPVGWLRQHGVLRRGTVLVHCQHLQRGDRGLIARAGATIAVCPGTIVWFRRPPPPVADWLAAGIPVALGTDSRASNTALSMRRELVAAAALWPGLPPRTLLAMATSHGGKALGLAAGALRPGRRADLFAVRADTDSADALLELLVQGEREVAFTCVRGRVWPARSRTPC